MEYGKVEYTPIGAPRDREVLLRLTLIGQNDDEVLRVEGLSSLRRRRVYRLACEAERQGHPLGYRDLCVLLFTSMATLKRDVRDLEDSGAEVPLRGRRRCMKRVGQAVS